MRDLFIIAAGLLLGSVAIAVIDTLAHVHRPTTTTQSWDQENLKRNDSGCPTAIYVAPRGNLEQCQ